MSPFARAELESVLERAGATARTARRRRSTRRRPAPGTSSGLRTAYDGWLAAADGLVDRAPRAPTTTSDEAAFAARFHLVHEWRKFLFADPGLPDELLPGDWPGRAAAELFADARRPGSSPARTASSPAAWRLSGA